MESTSLETLFVHAGNYDDWPGEMSTAPVLVPSVSFRAKTPDLMDAILGGEVPGFSYSRHANPTVQGFSEAVRVLEAGQTAQAFGSGMAALDAALFAVGLRPGDHVLLSQDLYGATLNLSEQIWGAMGIQVDVVDISHTEMVQEALQRVRPKALLFETLSNPLMKIPDLDAVIARAHECDCQVIVDNTFATPALARPALHGADLVVHSATKYLGGHGDALGGVVVGRKEYEERLHQYVKLRGGVLSPFDAWLLHRGLKTLGVRIERQVANALVVAHKLRDSGKFRRVWYPGLPDHPSYERARTLFGERGFGAVVTVEVPGGREPVFRLLSRLKLVGSATTVGDVYTLCLYPRVASHRNQSPQALAAMGITDETLRIAVGLEAADEIVRDILAAMEE
ncbi:MAG: methionine gamma-lyase [Sulfobacillus acidophilus]|uniref:homocysteine desulfhydrase n=1 Tax=Sulfobacillus acidophilus TaxID=53633 RepID=A0A2T2WD40_9FIRM|nr:MAG: methionine gamma-lyase [Sulfobacillus acidophilus]